MSTGEASAMTKGSVVITKQRVVAHRPSNPMWNSKTFYLPAGTLMQVIGVHRYARHIGYVFDLVPFLSVPEDDTWSSVREDLVEAVPPLLVLAMMAR